MEHPRAPETNGRSDEALINTCTVPEAGILIGGLSRDRSYDSAAAGEIPTIRFGRRVLVPIVALANLLGEEPETVRAQVAELRRTSEVEHP